MFDDAHSSSAFSHVQVVRAESQQSPSLTTGSVSTAARKPASKTINTASTLNAGNQLSTLSMESLANNTQGATFAAKARAAELQAARSRRELSERSSDAETKPDPPETMASRSKNRAKAWRPLNLQELLEDPDDPDDPPSPSEASFPSRYESSHLSIDESHQPGWKGPAVEPSSSTLNVRHDDLDHFPVLHTSTRQAVTAGQDHQDALLKPTTSDTSGAPVNPRLGHEAPLGSYASVSAQQDLHHAHSQTALRARRLPNALRAVQAACRMTRQPAESKDETKQSLDLFPKDFGAFTSSKPPAESKVQAKHPRHYPAVRGTMRSDKPSQTPQQMLSDPSAVFPKHASSTFKRGLNNQSMVRLTDVESSASWEDYGLDRRHSATNQQGGYQNPSVADKIWPAAHPAPFNAFFHTTPGHLSSDHAIEADSPLQGRDRRVAVARELLGNQHANLGSSQQQLSLSTEEWWHLDGRVNPRSQIQVTEFVQAARRRDWERSRRAATFQAVSTPETSGAGRFTSQGHTIEDSPERQRDHQIAYSILLPVLANLKSYTTEREHFNRHAQPPPWTIDQGARGNQSFFERDWGAPPMRVGRDPRYRSLPGDGRSTTYDSFGSRWTSDDASSWYS